MIFYIAWRGPTWCDKQYQHATTLLQLYCVWETWALVYKRLPEVELFTTFVSGTEESVTK